MTQLPWELYQRSTCSETSPGCWSGYSQCAVLGQSSVGTARPPWWPQWRTGHRTGQSWLLPCDMAPLPTRTVCILHNTSEDNSFASTKITRSCFYTPQYPINRFAQGVLHFKPWQTCSIEDHLDFPGKQSSTN